MQKFIDSLTGKKMLSILLLFVVVILGIRLLWLNYNIQPPSPLAKEGILDLRGMPFDDKRIVTINGEWEFYPEQLLEPASLTSKDVAVDRQWIQVPGSWKEQTATGTNFGIGTYRLRVLVDEPNDIYGLRLPSIQTASRLYINHELVMENGHPSITVEQNDPNNNPYSAYFRPDAQQLDVVIQVSNFDYAYAGGITQSIKLGTAAAIGHEVLLRQSLQLTVAVVILMHAFFSIILYFLGYRNTSVLFFTALLIFTFFAILSDDDRVLMEWFPMNMFWTTKIRLISYLGIGLCLTWFGHAMFGQGTFKRFMRLFNIFGVLCLLVALIVPLEWIVPVRKMLLVLFIINVIFIPRFVLGAIYRGEKDAFLILLSVAAVTVNQVSSGMIKAYFWSDMPYYPIDLIIAFLGFAAFWFNRFYQNTLRVQKLAADLQKADKLKDDFLANTSHELRNPLHGIINMAQSVLDEAKGELGSRSQDRLELMIKVSRRMALLLNDLLDVTLLKEHNLRLNKRMLNLHALAHGVTDMLRYLSEGKKLELVVDIPASCPPVLADENRLLQILFNLVHNAIKYTEEGTITISAESHKGMVVICVTDTGIGMDQETQARILKPYERGDSSISAIGSGIGLGLSITKQLVELHGGELLIHSIPGTGSEFSFSLAAAASVQESYADRNAGQEERIESAAVFTAISDTPLLREHANSAWLDEVRIQQAGSIENSELLSEGQRPRILIVDDDPVNLDILRDMLASEHYDITSMLSGKEALLKLHQGEWDLVVSDVMMPHMSGYELTERIRMQFSISELPIILLTARNQPEDVQTAFLSGANDYVTKPVGAMELRLRIRAWVSLKQSFGERLRMEAAWLQAQIQPHFLHNALNTIASLSEVDTDRMVTMLHEFGNYLHRSFDPINMYQLLPLGHELDLLRSYLYIEQERFGDRIQIQWDIAEDAEDKVRIPPLSLQTLVENALRHGILVRGSGGTVTVAVAIYGQQAEIMVMDDGVGIDEKQLEILLQPGSASTGGVGLKNTDKRLRQLYGKGLQISSSPGAGTVVSFMVPVAEVK
ncbi:hybrid sensor histidine kinase/response regulator [Paenibacillus massiliensis]|uniref:hybrid sensor histidine kinase/response regulator n=1 Tax=Paenibacillus massiliensis TaxID=225917 RepID=UPI001CF796BC|nr:ATP-binding protein [Paenibacillus massiliensis]